jgi:integrase
MTIDQAIDRFLNDLQAEGRINSPATVRRYRDALERLRDESGRSTVRKIDRDDVKRTLRRWKPNSARTSHSIFRSFFDYLVEEGVRPDNPARAVRRAKARPVSTYRLTREEVVRVLECSVYDRRSYRLAHYGLLAGLRRNELCGLQGRHLSRDGAIWVSADIAKGGKERWIPVLPELAPVVEETLALVGDNEYVIPARRVIDPPKNTRYRLLMGTPTSPKALWELCKELGERAGLSHALRPHLLRHAFGDHIAKDRDVRVAQALLGHADVSTTAGTYTSKPNLDELQAKVQGFSYRPSEDQGSGAGLEAELERLLAEVRKSGVADFRTRNSPVEPVKATTGIEPVNGESRRFSGSDELIIVGDVDRVRSIERQIDALEAKVVVQGDERYPEIVR